MIIRSTQASSLIHEIRRQPAFPSDISKIKFKNEILQRRSSVQLPDAEDRCIANAPAESLHGVTVAWLLQNGRARR
jgi:hypothetical protein